jgi:hypothetical protein
MARSRLELQTLLEGLTEHVYFQPPSTMSFPCIKYERDGSHKEWAGNKPYQHAKRYSVTVIDRNPDSTLPDSVEDLSFCAFDRAFQQDGNNHWVFTLFF